jgi:phosphoribosylaminoimidazolecarboxamide formyltransferase / IMP cyclohydrolase
MASDCGKDFDDYVAINRVLVSVSDIAGLDVLIPGLINLIPHIEIYATSGTYEAIKEILGEEAGCLTRICEYTGKPEIPAIFLNTMDFKIYMGLLSETYNPAHQAELKRVDAVPIDMVVVNLPPFKKTVTRPDVTIKEARAHIDIERHPLIRAAAKNYLRVATIVTPADYPLILDHLDDNAGGLTIKHRFALAQKAFAHTAEYDRAIADYLETQPRDAFPK